MGDFWANYKKKYITEPTLRKNGYYELSAELRKKFDYFNSDSASNKLSDYFSWEEFYELITKTTFLRTFSYNDVEYGLEVRKKQSCFYTEGTKEKKGFSEKYETPKDLLENARIDGKTLQELWNELKCD